ncbi:MAG: hypothetical protein U0804_21670 [Gemmataceae bacterium]
MTRQRHRLFEVGTGAEHVGDVAVPQRVKVSRLHSLRAVHFDRHAGGGEVCPEHVRRLRRPRARPDGFLAGAPAEVAAQVRHQRRGERLNSALAVLRELGGKHRSRRVGGEVEVVRGERSQFGGAVSGAERHAVEHHPVGTRQPEHDRRTLPGRAEHGGHFPRRELSPAPALVEAGVQRLHPAERVLTDAAVVGHPAGELVDGLEVVVRCLDGRAAVAQLSQRFDGSQRESARLPLPGRVELVTADEPGGGAPLHPSDQSADLGESECRHASGDRREVRSVGAERREKGFESVGGQVGREHPSAPCDDGPHPPRLQPDVCPVAAIRAEVVEPVVEVRGERALAVGVGAIDDAAFLVLYALQQVGQHDRRGVLIR